MSEQQQSASAADGKKKRQHRKKKKNFGEPGKEITAQDNNQQKAVSKKPNGKNQAKSSIPRPPPKTYFKVVVRNLPPTDFSKDDFVAAIEKICVAMGVPQIPIRVLHYIQGKVSNSRGGLGSAGFLSFEDQDLMKKFLTQVPSKILFLEASEAEQLTLQQPQVVRSLYQKTLKPRPRPDKLEGSYTTDPEYTAFVHRLENPVGNSRFHNITR